MEEKNILITNIQRFSLHDGPGIRTTVFLKGCSLQCPWCSNPENIDPFQQKYIKDGVTGYYGKYYSSSELLKECLKDKAFYDGEISDSGLWNISEVDQINLLPGGITFSGGECLLQIEALSPVCKELKRKGIHIAAETCLFVPYTNLIKALDYIDFFYVDMKIIDSDCCKAIENGNLDVYLKNLDTLLSWTDESKNHKPVVIRIPVIGNYTSYPENRNQIHKLLNKYKDKLLKIELIKEHNLGESKYKSLGMNVDYHGVEDGLMEKYKEELRDLGILTEICKV